MLPVRENLEPPKETAGQHHPPDSRSKTLLGLMGRRASKGAVPEPFRDGAVAHLTADRAVAVQRKRPTWWRYVYTCVHSPRSQLQVRVCPVGAVNCVIQPLRGRGRGGQTPTPPRPPPLQPRSPESGEGGGQQDPLSPPFRALADGCPSQSASFSPQLLCRYLSGTEAGQARKTRGGRSEPRCRREYLRRRLLSRTVTRTDCESPTLLGPERGVPAGEETQLRHAKNARRSGACAPRPEPPAPPAGGRRCARRREAQGEPPRGG